MLSTTESVIVAIAIIAASLGFLFLVNHFWPIDARREYNDVVGWQVSVIGMTHAVIVGFMLYAVWNDFEAARANVVAEANALVNVTRLAQGLPAPQRQQIQGLALQYSDAMIKIEWPRMRDGNGVHPSRSLTQRLWQAALQPESLDETQQISLNNLISNLTSMTERRRTRELEAEDGLPGILWGVLIVGAGITICSSCLFGTRSFPLHVWQVLGLSALVSLSLMAISDIARPFQGSVSVSVEPFVHAQETIQAYVAGQMNGTERGDLP